MPRKPAPSAPWIILEDPRWESAAPMRQTHRFMQLFQLYGERVRVEVARNAYDAQSYAKIEIYDPAQRCWNCLDTLMQSEMAILLTRDNGAGRQVPVIFYGKPLDAAAQSFFVIDAERLLQRAVRILQPQAT